MTKLDDRKLSDEHYFTCQRHGKGRHTYKVWGKSQDMVLGQCSPDVVLFSGEFKGTLAALKTHVIERLQEFLKNRANFYGKPGAVTKPNKPNETKPNETAKALPITEMRAAAIMMATKMRDRASDIERAADTIAAITRDHGRSESIDGPAWDKAAKILQDVGIPVPPSWHYTWA